MFDEQVAAVVELLDYATNAQEREGNLKPEYILHPKLLTKAKALQFVFTNKVGLVLGVTTGHGFTITKLHDLGDGSTAWSAPCFLSASSVSKGATIGDFCCSIVLSDKAAERLKTHGSISAGVPAEANLTLSEKRPSASVDFDALLLEDIVSLGLSDGLLVDLSAAVILLKVDAAQNEAAYGAGVGPVEILGGGSKPVSAPPAFGDLYDKLNEIIVNAK